MLTRQSTGQIASKKCACIFIHQNSRSHFPIRNKRKIYKHAATEVADKHRKELNYQSAKFCHVLNVEVVTFAN